MSTQTDELRVLLDKTPDEEVVIEYTDGTSLVLSHRKLLEEQLALSELADKFIDKMASMSKDPSDIINEVNRIFDEIAQEDNDVQEA